VFSFEQTKKKKKKLARDALFLFLLRVGPNANIAAQILLLHFCLGYYGKVIDIWREVGELERAQLAVLTFRAVLCKGFTSGGSLVADLQRFLEADGARLAIS
jgi:hypothetical protein